MEYLYTNDAGIQGFKMILKYIEIDMAYNQHVINYLPINIMISAPMSTGPLAQDQYNIVWTSFYLEIYLVYENKLQNLIPTSKSKFSFRGLIL